MKKIPEERKEAILAERNGPNCTLVAVVAAEEHSSGDALDKQRKQAR